MTIYETINLIKTKLEEGQDNASDLLFGYKIIVDPYCELSKYVPLILIEADRTELQTSDYGDPVVQDHYISFTVFESAQKVTFDMYKERVNNAVKKLISKLLTIEDIKIRKIIPTEMAHNEAEIDSMRCTGIILGVKVRTNWED